jgi:hypothetical protein
MYVTSFDTFQVNTIAGEIDFFQITPADDKPCVIHALFLHQSGFWVGDANSWHMRIKVIRGYTSGTAGGTPNEIPLNPNDGAASYTGGIEHSVHATVGTPVDLYSGVFDMRLGMHMIWTPKTRPIVTHAQGLLVVRLPNTVKQNVFMGGCIYVEEL